jgi:hypothetical protein
MVRWDKLEEKWLSDTFHQREKLQKLQLEARQKKVKKWDGQLQAKNI